MEIEQITPQEAQQLLQRGYRYLDVRTEGEFANGHPLGAINIPVAIPDPRTGQMAINPDFLSVVGAHFEKDEAVILGCQAGARSQRAAEMMAAAGFQHLANMQGGWGGGMDPRSGAMVPGWVDCGLPTAQQPAPGSTYAELRSKPR